MENGIGYRILGNQHNKLLRGLIVFYDLLILNIFSFLFVVVIWKLGGQLIVQKYRTFWLAINLSYFLVSYISPPILAYSRIGNLQVVLRSVRTAIVYAIVSVIIMLMIQKGLIFHYAKYYALYYFIYIFVLTGGRLLAKWVINMIRHRPSFTRYSVFVGDSESNIELYKEIMDDPSFRHEVLGYYSDKQSDNPNVSEMLPYLGTLSDFKRSLSDLSHHVDSVFCFLPESSSKESLDIMNYCDDHVIMFFRVPDMTTFMNRKMHIAYYGNVPVLYPRPMPLMSMTNKTNKRLFDIVFSSLFLILVFWWVAIIVSIIMKITMPGPIFFKQKRSGLDGKDFWCYKFRSMKVNSQSDTLQATKDDPRKTRFGNFMRHYNIDELPQFWNVFIGNMSVVGPRPHMLKHTEQYSKLVPKYMVRHFCKPGITGWAQVTGSRGETSELWQMEERIKKDIWYIENWSLHLDIKIIWMTIANMFGSKDEQAY